MADQAVSAAIGKVAASWSLSEPGAITAASSPNTTWRASTPGSDIPSVCL